MKTQQQGDGRVDAPWPSHERQQIDITEDRYGHHESDIHRLFTDDRGQAIII